MCESDLLFSICTRLLTHSHTKQMNLHNGPTHLYSNSSSLIPKPSPAQELETVLLIHTLTHIQIHILASTHMDTYSNARHAALINTHLHRWNNILTHHIYIFAYTPTQIHTRTVCRTLASHTRTHTDGTTYSHTSFTHSHTCTHIPTHTDGTTHQCTTRCVSSTLTSRSI